MIIRIEPAGGSFRGAGLYYLHDKAADKDLPNALKPATDERVWFTDTRNCANFDPELALDEMWATAEAQQWLKAQAGGRTSGRVCEDPVKTLSISWHKDDAPTPEHMIAAADAYLKAMQWDEHQAVFVGHRDTEHRHLHIILNRVHPETGRTLDDYRDHPRSQAFALAYEKEHGKLWCVDREINAAERENRAPDLSQAAPDRQPANTHMPHNVFDLTKPFERQFDAAESALRETIDRERGQLKEQQKQERLAFFEDGKRLFRATRVEIYRELKAEFRAPWAAFYAHQKAAQAFGTATVRDALLSAVYFARYGDFASARDSLHDRFAAADDIAGKLAEEKDALVKAQKEAIASRQKDACDLLMESRKADYEHLLERQRGERAGLHAAHAQGQSAAHVFEPPPFAPTPEQDSAQRAGSERPQQDAAQEPPRNADRGTGEHAPRHDQASDPHVRINDPHQHEAPSYVPSAPATGHRLEPEPKVPFDLTDGYVLPDTPIAEPKGQDQRWQHPDKGTALFPTPPIKEGSEISRLRDPSDAGAAVIGAVAEYLADQIGEFIAPTPPEVRAAQVAQRAEQQAARDIKAADVARDDDPWARYMAEAFKQIDEEQAKRSREYWTERDRSKDWERDR